MENYEKRGYLSSNFRLFHLTDTGTVMPQFHYHEFDKITILLKGNVHYTIEGKTYELQPYDMVLVRHNEIHRPVVDASMPYERIIIYISPSFIAGYPTGNSDLGYCFQKAAKKESSVLRIPSKQKHILFQTIRRLEASFSTPGYANELYQQVLFLEFMILLNRAVHSRQLYFLETAAYNEKIADILHYINANLSASLSIDTLASKFYLSKYYMMRLFKSETGCSIGNYITQKRLLQAKYLILSGTPVMDACFDCGFHDYSTFSRAYRKCFHESPRQTLASESSQESADYLDDCNTNSE